MFKKKYKNKVFKLLSNIQYGTLYIQDRAGEYRFVGKNNYENQVTVIIHDLNAYKNLVLKGTNGISASYIKREWSCDDLVGLLDLIFKNKIIFEKVDRGYAKLHLIKDAVLALLKTDTLEHAKKNILNHYDLGNRFFKQFLDPKMMYSCALFEDQKMNLSEAAELKLKKICEKLRLTEQDHLLEIGTGWGGLAIYAHQYYGCKVTTTTISDAQYEYSKNLIKEMNLSDSITVLNKDFRELKGSYDKIVSIEMLEAIGFKLFKEYFLRINNLLCKDGLFFLQCITINDKDYDRAKREIDFIKKYIFPGGCLPSLSIINKIISKHTQLKLCELDDIGPHYVKTLDEWKKNFKKNINTIFEMGFTESFTRMWEYYFAYCQAGFNNKHIGDIQGLWQKY